MLRFLLLFTNFVFCLANEKITLSWSNITVTHPKSKKSILQLSAGALYEGRLLGLLGPSGSGKSTFLSVISKRINTNALIVMDDVEVFREEGERDDGALAFVHQDDHFFGMLTVNETISLTASLKALKSKDVNQSIVNEILLTLALTPVMNSVVGDSTKRGISGGERKRLSVACELLGDPKFLLADEPTSGLDSFQAQKVVSLLHQLTRAKRISTVCCIHQPRSSIWTLFDDILLFCPGGKICYHGSREQILSYFNSLGFEVPPETNPAEFVIDLVSVDTNSAESIVASKHRIEFLVQSFAKRQKRKKDSRVAGVSDLDKPAVPVIRPVGSFLKRLKHLPFSAFAVTTRSIRCFSLLLGRALKQTARDGTTNITRFLISGLLAMIVGSVYGPKTDELNADNVASRINIIAQASVNVGMMTIIKTLQVFKKERVVVDRERAQGLYSAMEYLLAKILGELPLDAAIAAFFGVVLHKSTNLKTSIGDLARVMAALGVACSSFGLAVGSLCPAGDLALAVGPAVMVVYVMMGAIGPAGKGESLPAVLLPLRMASPFRWACEALCAAEFGGRSFQRKSSAAGTLVPVNKDAWHSAVTRSLKGVAVRVIGMTKAVGGLAGIVGGIVRRPERGNGKGLGYARPRPTAGDNVLRRLDIPANSHGRGLRVLLYMFLTHVTVAWLGLCFSGNTG